MLFFTIGEGDGLAAGIKEGSAVIAGVTLGAGVIAVTIADGLGETIGCTTMMPFEANT
jgi:hypothetical protein